MAPDEKSSLSKVRPAKARSESLNLPHSKSLLKTKGFSGKFFPPKREKEKSVARVNSPESPRADIESCVLNYTLNVENRGRNLTRRESFSEEEEAVVRNRSLSPKDLKRAQLIANTHPSPTASNGDAQLRINQGLEDGIANTSNPQLETTHASPIPIPNPTTSITQPPPVASIPVIGGTVAFPTLNSADAASLTQCVFNLSIAVGATLDMLERLLAQSQQPQQQQLSTQPPLQHVSNFNEHGAPIVTIDMLTSARNALRDLEASLPKNLMASSESSSSMPSSAPTTTRAPSTQKLRVPSRENHFLRHISGSDSAQHVPPLMTQNVAEVAARQATSALGTSQKKSPKGLRRTSMKETQLLADSILLHAPPTKQHSPRKRRGSKGSRSPSRGTKEEKEKEKERDKTERERQSRPRRMSTPNIAARAGDKKSIASSHHSISKSTRSLDPRTIADDSVALSLRNSNRTNDYLNARLNTPFNENNNISNNNENSANESVNKRNSVEPLNLATVIPTEIRIHTPPLPQPLPHPHVLSLSDPLPGPQRAQSAPSTHRLCVRASAERDFVAALLSSDDFDDVRGNGRPSSSRRQLQPMRLTVSTTPPSSSSSLSSSSSANDLLAGIATPNHAPNHCSNNTNGDGDEAKFNLDLADVANDSSQDSSRSNSSRVSSSSCSDEPGRNLETSMEAKAL